MQNKIQLEEICNKVIALSKSTGEFLKKEAQAFDKKNIEYKGSNDLVSYVDRESEKRLVVGLRDIFPEATFITEEGTIEKEKGEWEWVIDPLDGTTNYLHGLPFYTISIALLHNKLPKIGVVYEPNSGECFYAWKEGGAYCNGNRIKVSALPALRQSLIATGFPYSMLDKRENFMHLFSTFAQKTQGLRRLGSAALDLAYVACGRFEGYYEFNLKTWDVAAGILLVLEAGGTVTDYSGGNETISGREVLAAGAVHPEMLKVMKELW